MRGSGHLTGKSALFIWLLLFAPGEGAVARAHGLGGLADAVDIIHFDWVLREFAPDREVLSCGGENPTDPALAFEVRSSVVTPVEQRREHGYACLPRMDADNFCRASLNACRRRTAGAIPPTGSQDCWRWPGVSPPAPQDVRMVSESVRRRTMLYAAETFVGIKNDPEVLQRCCGSDEACRDHVRGVELEFMDGLPRGDRTSYYRWNAQGDNHVRISTAYLTNALTSESIDWILLHELGHACQFGKAIGMSTQTEEERLARERALRDLSAGDCESGGGAFGYVTSLGLGTGSCIRDALAAERPRQVAQGVVVCYSQWLEEAFASSVFSFRMNTIEQWAWMCRNGADHAHPQQQVYIGCLLNDPRIYRNFCGG